MKSNNPRPARHGEALGRFSAKRRTVSSDNGRYGRANRIMNERHIRGYACTEADTGDKHIYVKPRVGIITGLQRALRTGNSLNGMHKPNNPRLRAGPLDRPHPRHVLPRQLLLPPVSRPPNLRIKRPHPMETHRKRHPPTNTTESRTKRHETEPRLRIRRNSTGNRRSLRTHNPPP